MEVESSQFVFIFRITPKNRRLFFFCLFFFIQLFLKIIFLILLHCARSVPSYPNLPGRPSNSLLLLLLIPSNPSINPNSNPTRHKSLTHSLRLLIVRSSAILLLRLLILLHLLHLREVAGGRVVPALNLVVREFNKDVVLLGQLVHQDVVVLFPQRVLLFAQHSLADQAHLFEREERFVALWLLLLLAAVLLVGQAA